MRKSRHPRSTGPKRNRLATLAVYGPDTTVATKLVASVFRGTEFDPMAMRTWTSETSDVREDPTIAGELADFLSEHRVAESVGAERIIGCPHEEGIDYPLGRTCPVCPFWAGIDRFTHEPLVEPAPTMSPADILAALSIDRSPRWEEALISADGHRSALVDPLLAALDRGIANPGASTEDANLFSFALYLFAKWREPRATLTINGQNQLVDRMWVSGNFFSVLGVSPVLGRAITSADDAPGGGPDGPAVVISFALWQRVFGGSPAIIGKSSVVERIPVTVVGVAPPAFFGIEVGRTVDLMLPVRTEPLILPAIPFDDDVPFLSIMLRLKPEQSLSTAGAALRAVQRFVRTEATPHDPTVRAGEFLSAPFTLRPAATGFSALRDQFQRPLAVMLMVVMFVLLIACANIANLMLARGAARQYEFGVRSALGASRWQLIRQLLVETLLLAATGAALALIFANWASRAIVSQMTTSAGPVVLDLSSDWRVSAFTATMLIVTTVLCGVAPALRTTQVDTSDLLREQGGCVQRQPVLPHLIASARMRSARVYPRPTSAIRTGGLD